MYYHKQQSPIPYFQSKFKRNNYLQLNKEKCFANNRNTNQSPNSLKKTHRKGNLSLTKNQKQWSIDKSDFKQAFKANSSLRMQSKKESSKLKQNSKAQNKHVPSIFKKSKKSLSCLNQSSMQKLQVTNRSTSHLSNASKTKNSKIFQQQLSTTIEVQQEYKPSEQYIQPPSVQFVIKNENNVKFQVNKPYLQKNPTLDDFDLGQMLGKGAYGTVKIVKHKQTGYFYALKIYLKKQIADKMDRFIETIKLQMFCRHPNIAQLYSVFYDQEKIYLLMQLCIEGDLSHHTKQLKKNNDKAKQIIKGIVCGLTYLHQNQIIHRDIKLQNVLISYLLPKITDFDLAVYQKNPLQSRKTFCGSPAYFSPQMLTKYQYNNKVDIWSLGILCYQIICGYYPFELSKSNLMCIVNEDYKELPSHLNEDIRNFICIMLIKNPQQRAGWKHIINHAYLRN